MHPPQNSIEISPNTKGLEDRRKERVESQYTMKNMIR